jgi:type II secretory pathway pseudopilin PulG
MVEKSGKIQRKKGVALVLILFALTFLIILIFGFISLAQIHSRTTVNLHLSRQAYYAARAGLSYAINEIELDYRRDPEIDSTWEEKDIVFSDGVYFDIRWELKPTTSSLRTWKITSTGKIKSGDDIRASRTLTAWTEMGTFAGFNYLTDSEVRNGKPVYHSTNQVIEGRAHTNGYFSFLGQPGFTGKVTSSNGHGKMSIPNNPGRDDPYWNPENRTYRQGFTITTDPAKFYHYLRSYDEDYPAKKSENFSFAGGKPEIPLPHSNDSLSRQSKFNFDKNIYVDFFNDGTIKIGYYPNGNKNENILRPDSYSAGNSGETASSLPETVDQEQSLSAKPSPQKQIGFTSPIPIPVTPPVSVPVSDPGVLPTPAPDLEWIVISSTAEDVIIHSTENIIIRGGWGHAFNHDDRGVLKGRVTLSAANDIVLWGSIVYAGMKHDTLGLVARKDVVIATDHEKVRDIDIYASIMTLNGSLRAHMYDKGIPRGNLTIYGGVIQKTPGYKGTVTTDLNGNVKVLTGYKTYYKTDPKLAKNPPPGFPATGKLHLISVQDSGCFSDNF